MRQIITETRGRQIAINDVSDDTPIFAKKNGKLVGMLVRGEQDPMRWVLKVRGFLSEGLFRGARQKCIEAAMDAGYEFFVEEG